MTADKELTEYLGPDAAGTLAHWAEITGREVAVPAYPWVREGFTGALLAPVFVHDPDTGSQLVVVKVLPPGDTAEHRAHRTAIREAPEAFRDHLVQPVFEPLTLSSGGLLTFQALAGDSDEWRPLADLPRDRVPAACGVLTKSLFSEWNPVVRVKQLTIGEFLRGEIGEAGSVRPYLMNASGTPTTAWVRIGDAVMPNPLLLFGDDSVLGRARVDAIFGHTHSDLHDQNVLLRQRDNDYWLETFVLVDLMTYESAAQIGRDPVRLLLSVTARLLDDLSEPQRALLLRAFVRPDASVPRELPSFAAEPVRTIYRTAAAHVRHRAGGEVWRQQYLLTVIAQAMVMTTFDNFDSDQRWWFYRLAASAARQVVTDFHRSIVVPPDAPAVTNPFGPPTVPVVPREPEIPSARTPPEPARAQPPAPPPTGKNHVEVRNQITYSETKKRKVCGRLGRDWVAVATHFRIPPQARSSFGNNRKPYEVWNWIEHHGRLHELAPALRELGRPDLADVLDSDDA